MPMVRPMLRAKLKPILQPMLMIPLCLGLTAVGVTSADGISVAGSKSAALNQENAAFTSRVTLENERVRVVENSYEPGASSPPHTHEYPRAVYFIDVARLELQGPEGSTTQVVAEAGQTVWRPVETHTVRNIGEGRVRVVEIEVKPRR